MFPVSIAGVQGLDGVPLVEDLGCNRLMRTQIEMSERTNGVEKYKKF